MEWFSFRNFAFGKLINEIMIKSHEKSIKGSMLIFLVINAIYCYSEYSVYLLQLFYLDVNYLDMKIKRAYRNELKGLIR